MKFLIACLFFSVILNIILALAVGFMTGEREKIKKGGEKP